MYSFKQSNPKKLIGICCLSGCHYTAYVISRFLTSRSRTLSTAISLFEDARGELMSDEMRSELSVEDARGQLMSNETSNDILIEVSFSKFIEE